MNVDAGAQRPDIVVSDRHGTTADAGLYGVGGRVVRGAGVHTHR
jgi:hypothetical protein